MLNKIKTMVLVATLAIATLAVVGISKVVVIDNNKEIREAKTQIALIDSAKETKHEVDVYNLGYMINSYDESEAREAGLTIDEVVTIVKDDIKEKAVVDFSNHLLVLNTKDDLSNKISSISSGIYATTMGIACIALVIIVTSIASIVEHIESIRCKKAIAIAKAKETEAREAVLAEAKAVLAEASELEANIVDNGLHVDILKHMELIHYMKIVCHTTYKEDIQNLKNAMSSIMANM